MELLLTADPDKKAVLAYLADSKLLVLRDKDKLAGVAVLVEQGGLFELKNIAVSTEYQGQGVAKLMIADIKRLAKDLGAKVLWVGTGNSSLSQLALYQKCGFRMHEIKSGFFDSYPEPIFENGIRCIDMVRLRVEL
ncbi:GNAT family N-acetyltransferase [uncultured Zhongshania sp.]|uniref:GNAT family N-acetyltransferase n=1 Tax=uncultured Zhongshania sp. TaxID=1642288 RepID=UPI0025F3AA70|nr:GNAT family N-acetyltransferase [uncultured Zhongshania sp.]